MGKETLANQQDWVGHDEMLTVSSLILFNSFADR